MGDEYLTCEIEDLLSKMDALATQLVDEAKERGVDEWADASDSLATRLLAMRARMADTVRALDAAQAQAAAATQAQIRAELERDVAVRLREGALKDGEMLEADLLAERAKVARLRDVLARTLDNCKFWSDDFKDEVRAVLEETE